MPEPRVVTPRVVIVGAGPAGLSAGARIGARIEGEVLIVDREAEAGGIPRHADHPGYGMRDRKQFLTGPSYAKKLVREAREAGATILTSTQVTEWTDDSTLLATSPNGRLVIRPKVTVLATGARERPRPARMVPGDRSDGVYTTGQLQNMVHLHHQPVGRRAVVIGAELVSWSAVMTLREAGCKTTALISAFPKGESYSFFTHPGQAWFRTKVFTESTLVRIIGKGRVGAVEVLDHTTGEVSTIECDTVVFTGDWIPDNELARMGGLVLDEQSLGPVVDASMRTSKAGVFAVGNLNHPVETADVVALEGAFVGDRVVDYLNGSRAQGAGIRLIADPPLRWLSPGLIRPQDGPAPRRRLVSWTDEFVASPTVTATQDGRVIGHKRLWWPAAPGRVFRIPTSLLDGLNPSGGEIHICVS